MKGHKAQASLEYMVILALSLGVFAGVIYSIAFLVPDTKISIGIYTGEKAVESIREASDLTYIHGHPSKNQIRAQIPENIEDIEIANNTVRLRTAVFDSYTDIYDVTKGNMSSDISLICPSKNNCRSGNYVFIFESLAPGSTGFDLNVTTE